MSKVEEKIVELMKKAKDFIPDGGYSEKELNLAFYMFIEGYHQAEKDLELTWDDMMTIHKCIKDAMNFKLYKMMEGMEGQKEVYEEVLKRFKDLKNENQEL